jgi:hypothetical protein
MRESPAPLPVLAQAESKRMNVADIPLIILRFMQNSFDEKCEKK